LREDSKGCACKRSRGRACVTESSPGHHLFLKRSAYAGLFSFAASHDAHWPRHMPVTPIDSRINRLSIALPVGTLAALLSPNPTGNPLHDVDEPPRVRAGDAGRRPGRRRHPEARREHAIHAAYRLSEIVDAHHAAQDARHARAVARAAGPARVVA